MGAHHTPWGDERVALLKKLWSDGLSANQIAVRLGNCTRNSVIAKLHRLGCTGKMKRSRNIAPRAKRSKSPTVPKRNRHSPQIWGIPEPGRKRPPPVPHVPTPELVVPANERKSIYDLAPEDCRWSIGDVGTKDFHFCNRQHVEGLPYCEFHAVKAYVPAQVPKRREQKQVLPAKKPELADA